MNKTTKATGERVRSTEKPKAKRDFLASFTHITVRADGTCTVEPPKNNKE